MSWFAAVVMVLAVARINRFLTEDILFRPTREWIMTKEAHWRKGRVGAISVTTLINCHWCSGIWVSAGVIGLTGLIGVTSWVMWVWGWLALAHLGAMVNEREERVE